MSLNTKDKPIERNYIRNLKFLSTEYELVKAKKHKKFRFAKDFYAFNSLDRLTFLKYYKRL